MLNTNQSKAVITVHCNIELLTFVGKKLIQIIFNVKVVPSKQLCSDWKSNNPESPNFGNMVDVLLNPI